MESLAGTGRVYNPGQGIVAPKWVLHVQVPHESGNRPYGLSFNVGLTVPLGTWLKELPRGVASLAGSENKYFPLQWRIFINSMDTHMMRVQILGSPPFNRPYGAAFASYVWSVALDNGKFLGSYLKEV